MTAPRLIAGLGNPGPEHANDRHNAGFWFVDALAREHGVAMRRDAKFFGELGKGRIDGHDCWLLKPLGYMNRSGQAVGAVANFYRIAPAEVLVAYDELDLEPGVARLKLGGSSTHNGLRDITARLAGPAYWRLRFGIGHPRDIHPGKPVADFVLGAPSREHRRAIDDAIDRAIAVIPRIVSDDYPDATRILHTAPDP